MIHNCWLFYISSVAIRNLYIINDSNSDIVRVFWILPRHSTIPIIPAVLEKESAENIYEALLQRHPVGFWSFWALIEGGHLCCYIRMLLAPTINHINLIQINYFVYCVCVWCEALCNVVRILNIFLFQTHYRSIMCIQITFWITFARKTKKRGSTSVVTHWPSSSLLPTPCDLRFVFFLN